MSMLKNTEILRHLRKEMTKKRLKSMNMSHLLSTRNILTLIVQSIVLLLLTRSLTIVLVYILLDQLSRLVYREFLLVDLQIGLSLKKNFLGLTQRVTDGESKIEIALKNSEVTSLDSKDE